MRRPGRPRGRRDRLSHRGGMGARLRPVERGCGVSPAGAEGAAGGKGPDRGGGEHPPARLPSRRPAGRLAGPPGRYLAGAEHLAGAAPGAPAGVGHRRPRQRRRAGHRPSPGTGTVPSHRSADLHLGQSGRAPGGAHAAAGGAILPRRAGRYPRGGGGGGGGAAPPPPPPPPPPVAGRRPPPPGGRGGGPPPTAWISVAPAARTHAVRRRCTRRSGG